MFICGYSIATSLCQQQELPGYLLIKNHHLEEEQKTFIPPSLVLPNIML